MLNEEKSREEIEKKIDLSEEEIQMAKAVGLTEEDAFSAKRIANIGFLMVPEPDKITKEGPPVIVTVIDERIKNKDPLKREDTPFKEDVPIIEVLDEAGIRKSFALSAKSARMHLFKLMNDLKRRGESLYEKKIAIRKVFYEHEKYKETVGYRIDLVERSNIKLGGEEDGN